MRLIIISILISSSLFSCQHKINAKFGITNGTKNSIDSINIKSSTFHRNLNYISLSSNETKVYYFNMAELPKVDGDYILTFRNNSTSIYKRFGYYTNGYPLEKITKILIKKDTIFINQIYNEY